MKSMSVCSGIGVPELGSPAHWQSVVMSEIEAFPRAVLSERFGAHDVRSAERDKSQTSLFGDMCAINPRLLRRLGIALPEVLIGGTPCQAFSIAGLRKGLGDARGNLTLQFVRMCHAFRNAGSLRWAAWENVPGVLSDKGNAFGHMLAGLVGADNALCTPGGGSWPSAGMASGPRARVAWRILDAQYFGVPQRRRRVFLVAGFGDGADPAKVLFERRSLHGDSAPSRETGQGVAPAISSRAKSGGGLGTDFDCDGGLIAARMTAIGEYKIDGTDSTLKQRDHKDVTDIVAFAENSRAELRLCGGDGQISSQLTTGGGNPGQGLPAIAFGSKDSGLDAQEELSPTLRAGAHDGSHQNAGVPPAVAFDLRGRDGGAQFEGPHDTAAMRATDGGSSRSYLAESYHVRRLTPRECERLQGIPDDFTLISSWPKTRPNWLRDCLETARWIMGSKMHTWRDALALARHPDGPRYKALGNAWAAPCGAWVLHRLDAVDRGLDPQAAGADVLDSIKAGLIA